MNKSMSGSRASRLRAELERSGLDGVVVVPGPNLRYFTGVDSLLLERPFMLLVPSEGEARLIAPELEAGPYRDCEMPMKIHSWTDSQGSAGAIGKALADVEMKGKWGVEGKVPFLFLSKVMKRTRTKFEDAEPILQGLREVKDPEEVRLLKKAGRILSDSFEEFPGILREGRSEIEVGKSATELIYEHGATKVDAMLVQSGPRAADPHSLPSSRKVRKGEGVIFDVGATFEGYYADITRTICVGKAPEVERVYERVLEAEEKGIKKAGAGTRVGAVDGAARGTLEKAGLGRYFIHRTGHGLGLEVHEAPYIVEGGKEKLGEGMCFTVEPGAYIRGKLGVRIEDDVLVEGGDGVAITDTPKEFGWWS
ncbi:MAG: aminopeptidase P family protein [archaeon]|nr:MAG: aminopeptidase P family protein [archaeon]